jgi:hypothetical protein
MQTALKSLLFVTLLSTAGTTAAFAETACSANRNCGQSAMSYPSASTDEQVSCSTRWINFKRDFRHSEAPCEDRLFSHDIPELDDCSTSCEQERLVAHVLRLLPAIVEGD